MTDLCCGEATESAEVLVDRLEYALSLAKKQQGVVRFDETILLQMQRRHELTVLLRRSIAEGRFQVWYQPIHCCHKQNFCSAEALLRLSDFDGTPIPPDVFIPLAEETGLISDLTWIVLEDICRLLSSGTVPRLQSVSLNLSMQQLLDPELAGHIRQILDRYAVAPGRIKAEITERFLLHDAACARTQLAALADAGIDIYMDDFGTGYSNLSSVLDYPFTFIKLDRSLVLHVPGDQRAELMLRTLVTMFHSLGKRLITEGVETASQAAYAAGCGSDMIQGFYFARPMPPDQLKAFLDGLPADP